MTRSHLQDEPRALAVLQALAIWRAEASARANLAANLLMRDDTLVMLAMSQVGGSRSA